MSKKHAILYHGNPSKCATGGRSERGGESAYTMDGATFAKNIRGFADAAAAVAAATAAAAECNAEPEVETLHSPPFDRLAPK